MEVDLIGLHCKLNISILLVHQKNLDQFGNVQNSVDDVRDTVKTKCVITRKGEFAFILHRFYT